MSTVPKMAPPGSASVLGTLRSHSYNTQANFAAVAQRLRILLHAVSMSRNTPSPVFVLGFSGVSARHLPRGSMGCPVFEYTRTLPSIKTIDREVILSWAMKKEAASL